jgi:hypothetical protein
MVRQKVVNILRLARWLKTEVEVVRCAKTTHSLPRQAVDGLGFAARGANAIPCRVN